VVRRLVDGLLRGRHLVISRGTQHDVPPDVHDNLMRPYQAPPNQVKPQSQAEIVRCFRGLELIATVARKS
jgi:hypothetical protein